MAVQNTFKGNMSIFCPQKELGGQEVMVKCKVNLCALFCILVVVRTCFFIEPSVFKQARFSMCHVLERVSGFYGL